MATKVGINYQIKELLVDCLLSLKILLDIGIKQTKKETENAQES